MSPSFPPEILDIIVNQLRDEPTALKACCVVSKSWIHRTRKHLFASVELRAPNSHIEQWKKKFPDPSNSPAHHTRSLSIYGLSVITAEDADTSDWIRTFHNLVYMRLDCTAVDRQVTLTPFHGLSSNPQIAQSEGYLPGGFRPHLFLSPSRGSRVDSPLRK
jgi:hypothetical protein